MAMETRARILAASLDLFNRDGVRRATTNHIAAHAGISPGNLYYHFRSREEIVRELFPAVAAATRQTLVLPPAGVAVTARDVASYHLSGIGVLWDFRFFYRDLNEIVSRDAVIAARYRELQEWLVRQFAGMFDRLVAQGDMRPPGRGRDVRRCAENAVIVWTSWVNFLATSGRTDIRREDVTDGALHGLLTFAAYLDAPFAARIRAAVQRWRPGGIGALAAAGACAPAARGVRRRRSRRS